MPRRARLVENHSKRGEHAPYLSWPGRTWRPGAPWATPAPAVAPLESFPGGGGPEAGRLVFGDALDVARSLEERGWRGTVDLVYVDPPFASQAVYTQEIRLDGPADGRVHRVRAYDDSWSAGGPGRADDGIATYLDMLAPRLEAMAALLKPTGTLWVHLDWRASYLVRVLLDEIFGRERFLNEIVWRRAPNLGRQAASGQFGRTLDTIVVYGGPDARLTPPTRLEPIDESAIRWDDEGRPFTTAPRGDYTEASMARLAALGRVHTTATGRTYVKYFLERDADGVLCRERRIDTLWTDVAPLRHASPSERTGYPTQKPRALLDRIVRSAAPRGGLVVDLFAGSGTTGEAAHAHGCRFLVGDASPVAINAARARLVRGGVPFGVDSCGDVAAPGGGAPEVRVTTGRAAGGGAELTVDLLRPVDPFAWAVGASEPEGQAFRATWCSARRPGTVPVAPDRVARLAAPAAAMVDVRVYGDDGSVSTTRHAAPPSP